MDCKEKEGLEWHIRNTSESIKIYKYFEHWSYTNSFAVDL